MYGIMSYAVCRMKYAVREYASSLIIFVGHFVFTIFRSEWLMVQAIMFMDILSIEQKLTDPSLAL